MTAGGPSVALLWTLVFLNNVGKKVKYKLWYYAAVFFSGLDQCYYKLLQGASRPLSCIVSLFKINIFITIASKDTGTFTISTLEEVPY